jgi:hypothetical protein
MAKFQTLLAGGANLLSDLFLIPVVAVRARSHACIYSYPVVYKLAKVA